MPNYKPTGKRANLTKAEAQQIMLEGLGKGLTVTQAAEQAGRHPKTYEYWRSTDDEFRAAVDRMRLIRDGGGELAEDPGFSAFSEEYLDQRVFPHIQNVVDLLEGREPSWTPAGIVYDPGEPDLVVVNMPPEHAKSTSITMNYSTYRIATNPNIRIIIVSKTQTMARKFLFGIKSRLTHPKYAKLIGKFGPPGGFERNSESWSQDMIYISPDARDSGEKDPTVQALGIRGHIYGARADLIILDDPVDGTNAHEYAKQIEWIQSEVMSRLSPTGVLLVVGTRLAAKDLYGELLKGDYYPDEDSPFTYLSMPAVLEFADDPKDWVTLWPRSNQPEIGGKGELLEPDADGLFIKWDGPRLFKRRGRMSPRTWAQVYQQQQSTGEEIFPADAVKASINGARLKGPIPRNVNSVREGRGMDGLVIVAGMDPASPSGFVAAVCIGLDMLTQKRYVIDVFNRTGQKPDDIRGVIKDWTSKYNVSEWRIEKNAFQTMLTQDREVREFLTNAGSVLREHHTGQNKWDADFGVTSLTMLFQGWEQGHQLIELPSTVNGEAVKALVEQLVTWYPDMPKRQRSDIVMALWFAELGCRDRIAYSAAIRNTHANNPFATPYDLSRRTVANLSELEHRVAQAV